MQSKPKVLVIMAVYNTDFTFVKRAIDSVLKQSIQNFKLIVVDDGSDYDPEQKLLRYIEPFKHKITYLHHQNCGQSQSINRAILQSESEYITILDSDDEYEPHHLQACLNQMHHADLIASTTKTIVDKEEDYYVPDKYDRTKSVHVDECILFATLFGKREVFTTLKFHDAYAADAHFYEKASEQFKVKKVNLGTYIYYRNNPNSICAKMKNENFVLVA
jgi:glycosyltransferase involved in cell wall biosynthesis